MFLATIQFKEWFFFPSTTYEGKSFEEDGVVHVHLTPEGADLFAKTARDAKLRPYNWLANRVKEITSTEQRVSLLYEGVDRLDLGGNSWCDLSLGRAFGVFKTGEASA
jgi:hypothetical protein